MYIFATVLFPFTNAKLNKKLSDFIENLDGIEKWKGIEGVYKYLIYSIEEVVSTVKQWEEAGKFSIVHVCGATIIVQVWI